MSEHHHHHAPESDRGLLLAVGINVLITVAQGIGGIISGNLISFKKHFLSSPVPGPGTENEEFLELFQMKFFLSQKSFSFT
jgi:hypothetical protein